MSENSPEKISSNSRGSVKTHKQYVYEVAEVPTYENYSKWGFMISEPIKYFSTLATIIIGMILFYVFSTRR